ncbi:hypothetical protein GP486_005931 [Trichoglossum hirsutum]|uniref:ADF-H domain-containing protein n=1 Tax=Trichoglossum hirsutum TaxID=265104 RepID=A0A9P8RLC3_9PEZI|nr:hypothetical protein GP486_005931 [Trichoglossum hirsutum]
MSLNGLDNANVVEAYEAAAAEPGGWDEVELLGRGSNGVVEIRGAISQYTEASPLYGFIRYRRRSILIRYVPEGTSRLVQAIAERFSPHDTVFPITAPKELNDTSLSAACSLHTATGSTSSSNSSLRRRRLVEITEDAEEHLAVQPNGPSPPTASATEERPPTAAGPGPVVKEDGMKPIGVVESRERPVADVPASSSVPPRAAKRSKLENVLSSSHGNKTSSAVDSTHGLHSRLNEDHRTSANSVRPSARGLYSGHSYTSKPKIKLGPRPSLDTSGRPYTSGSVSRQHEPRPISTLPAGIRIPRKNSIRPRSQYSEPVAVDVSRLPANPNTPISPMVTPTRPTTSPGVAPATPPSAMPSKLPPKSSAMTPEKQKLMKALQLRKKQLSVSRQEEPIDTDAASETTGASQYDVDDRPEAVDQSESAIGALETTRDAGIAEPGGGLEQTSAGNAAESTSIESNSPRSSMDELSQSTKGTQLSEMDTAPSPAKECDLEPSIGADPSSAESTPTPGQSKGAGSSRRGGRLWLDTGIQGLDLHENHDVSRLSSPTSEAVAPPSIEEGETIEPEGTSHMVEDVPTQEPGPAAVTNETELASEGKTYDGGQNEVDRDRLQQGPVDTGRTDQDVDHSEDFFLSDDSFMDELNTVTVLEAKPMVVTKSPVTKSPKTPGFPSATPALPTPLPDDCKARGDQSPATPVTPVTPRTVSNPARLQRPSSKHLTSTAEVPVIETARSVSASFLSSARSKHAPALSAKKVNVSSGISQRIKALELRSGGLSAPTTPPASSSTPTPSPPPPVARKLSVRSPTLTPPALALDSKENTPTGSREAAPTPSLSPSPEPLKVQTQALPSLHRQGITTVTIDQQKPRPESISVIARIIRDDNPLPSSDHKDSSPLELHQSPLIIEHQQGTSLPLGTRAKPSTAERPSSVLSSSPSSKPDDSSPTLSRPASIVSKQSSGSRGRSEKRVPEQRRGSSASGSAIKEDKKESKKSRLLRRMSSLSSSSRKSLAHAVSPTLKEEPTFDPEPIPEVTKPASLLEGWVNVQLPDTLVSCTFPLSSFRGELTNIHTPPLVMETKVPQT